MYSVLLSASGKYSEPRLFVLFLYCDLRMRQIQSEINCSEGLTHTHTFLVFLYLWGSINIKVNVANWLSAPYPDLSVYIYIYEEPPVDVMKIKELPVDEATIYTLHHLTFTICYRYKLWEKIWGLIWLLRYERQLSVKCCARRRWLELFTDLSPLESLYHNHFWQNIKQLLGKYFMLWLCEKLSEAWCWHDSTLRLHHSFDQTW